MRGNYNISLTDLAAIQSLPVAWVWAWMDNAKRRHDSEIRFRANLLAAIMTAGGFPVNPQDLYPKQGDFDEQIRRIMRNG